MPINPNETTAERAARLAAELQAVEQEAMEELRKKRASLRKEMEETQRRAREEEEGAARCAGCAGRRSRCWVDPARIQKWKEAVAR